MIFAIRYKIKRTMFSAGHTRPHLAVWLLLFTKDIPGLFCSPSWTRLCRFPAALLVLIVLILPGYLPAQTYPYKIPPNSYLIRTQGSCMVHFHLAEAREIDWTFFVCLTAKMFQVAFGSISQWKSFTIENAMNINTTFCHGRRTRILLFSKWERVKWR